MAPEFFNKLKIALFGAPRRSGEGKSAEQADVMVKMNLPPLLGRRDAAYEKFEQEFSDDLIDRPRPERLEAYRRWFRLLEIAGEDTLAVIVTLSNPDTTLRERRLANHLSFLSENLAIASAMAGAEGRLLEGDEAIVHLAAGDSSARLRQLLDSYWQSGLAPERRRELERQIRKYDRIIGALMPVAG